MIWRKQPTILMTSFSLDLVALGRFTGVFYVMAQRSP
ncbi:hypothetical protein RDI58_012922 [Solanum bulbocastanum]|uniref:Uncharacterized protein n=1 Tax=Solanum bulbocastanum TaxID=147425 RepID=A0AAN8TIK4_SOLBU